MCEASESPASEGEGEGARGGKREGRCQTRSCEQARAGCSWSWWADRELRCRLLLLLVHVFISSLATFLPRCGRGRRGHRGERALAAASSASASRLRPSGVPVGVPVSHPRSYLLGVCVCPAWARSSPLLLGRVRASELTRSQARRVQRQHTKTKNRPDARGSQLVHAMLLACRHLAASSSWLVPNLPWRVRCTSRFGEPRGGGVKQFRG